jgi:hypothetical protein
MTRALDLAARNDLHASLPCGDPDRPAAPHGPAVCLLDGLPRPGRPRRGSLRAHECSLRPSAGPSTHPAGAWPGDTRSPGAGEEPVPDQQAGGEDRGGPGRDPHPRRHLLTHPTRKEDQPTT